MPEVMVTEAGGSSGLQYLANSTRSALLLWEKAVCQKGQFLHDAVFLMLTQGPGCQKQQAERNKNMKFARKRKIAMRWSCLLARSPAATTVTVIIGDLRER